MIIEKSRSYKEPSPAVAIILPCYNEEAAIGKTVDAFKQALPNARIWVFDNNSTDATAEVALAAGAEVRREGSAGKGNVVRRMFADIDADFYIMADGDATYDASSAPAMLEKAQNEKLDMVVGRRLTKAALAYRPGHKMGNSLLTSTLSFFFGDSFTDILSGYRVFSKRFVKTFPAFAQRFEIETELSVFALGMRLPIAEVDTEYYERPEGSFSKLSTYQDGVRILSTIINLVRQERPLFFFGVIGLILTLVSFSLAAPLVVTFLETGLVPRFPTAVLSASLVLLGALFIFAGLILDTVVRGRKEALRLAYLQIPFFNQNTAVQSDQRVLKKSV